MTSVRVLVSPSWWAFWIINTGVLLPLCTVLLLASPARRVRWLRLGPAAARALGTVPDEALRWCLPFMVVFALANVVVFQSLKRALFKAVAASAEPRQKNKMKSAQGPASGRCSVPARRAPR